MKFHRLNLLTTFIPLATGCDLNQLLGLTLFVQGRNNTCYKVDLTDEGDLSVDDNNRRCENSVYNVDEVISYFDLGNSTSSTLVMQKGGPYGWSGEVVLEESDDPTVYIPRAKIIEKNWRNATYEAKIIFPMGCFAPSSVPSSAPSSVPSETIFSSFESRAELKEAVNLYCANPGGWKETSKYATYGPIESWDVHLIEDMSHLFQNQATCNPNISEWDVSNVKSFYEMFYGAASFNGDLSTWDVSSGTTFYDMFAFTSSFNGDLSKWNVSSATRLRGMFWNAYAFNQDLSSWDVSSCTDFIGMFGYSPFNQDISDWDVSSGTYFTWMFQYAESFNQNISNWDVSSGTNFDRMFDGATSFDQDLCPWKDALNSASKFEFCDVGAQCQYPVC